MSSPMRGRVVLAEVADPQGGNRKVRPLVIVTATEEIRPGETFEAVAITGTFPNPLPPECVVLPYANQPSGHLHTGLRKPSVAMCNWVVPLRHEDIVEYKGIMPGKPLFRILQIVDALASD